MTKSVNLFVALLVSVTDGYQPTRHPHQKRVLHFCPCALPSDEDRNFEAKINRALLAVDKLKGTSYGTPKTSTLTHSGKSRLFLDTADQQEWEKHLTTGIFTGITTNPVLLQRADVKCTVKSVAALARCALEEHQVEEFMIQAWGGGKDALIRTGSAIAGLDGGSGDRVVVKLPLTVEGVSAARVLGADGARICMTACYNREEAFLATGLGTEYVAPYLGRMTDLAGKDGVAECAAMAKIVQGMGGSTRVLVASLRSASQLSELAAQGCDTFTFSPAIANELFTEPLTMTAAEEFEKAALAMGGTSELN